MGDYLKDFISGTEPSCNSNQRDAISSGLVLALQKRASRADRHIIVRKLSGPDAPVQISNFL